MALIADFLYVEEAATDTDVRFTYIFYAVNDCRANCPSNAVVVGFTYSADCCDIGLHNNNVVRGLMLDSRARQIGEGVPEHAFLGDDDGRV
jgi:hypothetical protein